MAARLVHHLWHQSLRVGRVLGRGSARRFGRALAVDLLHAAVRVLDQHPVFLGVDHFVMSKRWRLQLVLAILLLALRSLLRITILSVFSRAVVARRNRRNCLSFAIKNQRLRGIGEDKIERSDARQGMDLRIVRMRQELNVLWPRARVLLDERNKVGEDRAVESFSLALVCGW